MPPSSTTTSGTIPATMRAFVKDQDAPGFSFDAARPVPAGGEFGGLGEPGEPGVPGFGEVLVRVMKVGVCGTDRHIFEWDDWAKSAVRLGVVVGHEYVGIVEKLGAGALGVQVGQRVVGEGHVTAGVDYNSRTGNAHVAKDCIGVGIQRDGCFADYLCVPAVNLWPVDDAVPDKFAAIMDPLGNAVHTVMEAGVSARNVLITGVGAIGLMAVTVAKAAGAAKIFAVDVNPERLAIAKLLGADEIFDAREGTGWVDEVRKATRGEGADALLEMSGAQPSFEAGFDALRNGGVASLLGVPSKPFAFDWNSRVIFKGVTVKGIYGRRMFQTWYDMENLMLSGRLDLEPIVTHELPLESAGEAIEMMQRGEAIKVVLDVNPR